MTKELDELKAIPSQIEEEKEIEPNKNSTGLDFFDPFAFLDEKP